MNGVEVESIEQKWFIAVYRILKKLGIYLIADKFDTSVLYDAVECITKDITKCNIDVFGKGAKSKTLNHLSMVLQYDHLTHWQNAYLIYHHLQMVSISATFH